MRIALAALLVIVAVVPARAEDDPAPTVVLLSPRRGGWPEAERRAAAELVAAGFRVERIEIEGKDARPPRAPQGALALLLIRRSHETGDVHLWVEDKVTGKTSKRRLTTAAAGQDNPDAAGTIGLRAFELLRASLLELRLRRRAAAGETRPVPAAVDRLVEAPPPPGPGPFRLALGGRVVGTPGGVGPLLALAVDAAWRFRPHLSADLELFGSVLQDELTGTGGSARVGLGGVVAYLSLEPWAGAAISPALGAGGGLLLAWSSGDGADPYIGQGDLAPVALLSGRGSVTVRLTRSIRLLGCFDAGVALPGVTVRFAGQGVTSLGRPLLQGTLALGWVP